MLGFHRKFAAWVFGLLVLATLLSTTTVFAEDGTMPMVPKAKARYSDEQACVEPIDEMRKNHMEHILHQRDDTMHLGIRTKQYSLAECLNCHVPEKSGDQKIRYGNPEHFCDSCHSYVAVSIDCFQCHSDQPTDKPMTSSMRPADHGSASALGNAMRMFAAGDSKQ